MEETIGTFEAEGYWPNQLIKITLTINSEGKFVVSHFMNGKKDGTVDSVFDNLNEASHYFAFSISANRYANN